MKRYEVVGGLLFGLIVASGAGCGSSADGTNPLATHDAGHDIGTNIDAGAGAEDAGVDGGIIEAGEDAGQGLPDVGVPPQDSGNPTPVVDSGTPPPPPVDAGMTGGVCPAACAASSDCNPCWSAGEMHGSNNYCCVSGLCIFRTGTCDVTPPPPTDGGTGGVGGTDGGGGGLDAGGGSDAGSPGGGTDGGGGGGGSDGSLGGLG